MAKDFTVVRNSPKWVLNKDGQLEKFDANYPAFEFKPNGEYKGTLIETSANQLLFNNTDTPVIQTVTVQNQEYTLSFYGNGSVVLTGAASETLTSIGPDAERVSLTFTPEQGTLLLTPSGEPKYWQLERGSIATSYIQNNAQSAVGETRDKDVITMSSASDYLPSEGKIVMVWEQLKEETIYIGETYAVVTPGQRKLEYEYSSISQILSIDGEVTSQVSGNYDFSGMDKIELGHVNGLDQPNTHIYYFAIF